MEIAANLKSELAQIRKEQGLVIEANNMDGSNVCVVIKGYKLPKKMYNREITDLLILVPSAYPNGKLDMFWADEGLTFADGKIPQSAENIEIHCGKKWRRFSRHIANWNPARDSLSTYLINVDHWLRNKTNI